MLNYSVQKIMRKRDYMGIIFLCFYVFFYESFEVIFSPQRETILNWILGAHVKVWLSRNILLTTFKIQSTSHESKAEKPWSGFLKLLEGWKLDGGEELTCRNSSHFKCPIFLSIENNAGAVLISGLTLSQDWTKTWPKRATKLKLGSTPGSSRQTQPYLKLCIAAKAALFWKVFWNWPLICGLSFSSQRH